LKTRPPPPSSPLGHAQKIKLLKLPLRLPPLSRVAQQEAAAATKLAEEKVAAERAAALKAQQQEAAAAVLKAQQDLAAALEAQQEAGHSFSELASWRLEAENVVGKVGTVKQITPACQHPALRQAAVHRVTNPALQAAYERKKGALAARLGDANVNEQFLIPGTSLANSEAIIRNNFCLSKVRNTMTMPLLCVRCQSKYLLLTLSNTPAGEDTFG
jgi:hypothetical protein